MPRGYTEEGYPCKYAPYYRGYYKSNSEEERQKAEKRLRKTYKEIAECLLFVEKLALPNEKHYWHELRKQFEKEAKKP